MIKLDVPLVMQNPKSNDCGIKCIEMVSKYYNKPELIENIGDLPREKDGTTFLSEIAIYLLKNNFDVEMVTLNPEYYTLDHRDLSKQQQIHFFKNHINKNKENSWMEGYLELLKLGGVISNQIIKKNILNQAIIRNKLGIQHCTTRFMQNALESKFNFHFVLATGIDSNFVYINDPAFGKRKITYEEYLYSSFSTSMNGFGAGALLLISPRE